MVRKSPEKHPPLNDVPNSLDKKGPGVNQGRREEKVSSPFQEYDFNNILRRSERCDLGKFRYFRQDFPLENRT